MAASWITIVTPYLPEIVRLARPIFTRLPPPADNSQQLRLDVINAQIGELQDAASQNADSIGKLASDMQQTLQTLQAGADRMERRMQRIDRLALVAATAAVLAFGLAAYALVLSTR